MTPEQVEKYQKVVVWLDRCQFKQNAELYYTYENARVNGVGEVYCEHCKHGASHPIHLDLLSNDGFMAMVGKLREERIEWTLKYDSDNAPQYVYVCILKDKQGSLCGSSASTPAEALANAILQYLEGR